MEIGKVVLGAVGALVVYKIGKVKGIVGAAVAINDDLKKNHNLQIKTIETFVSFKDKIDVEIVEK